MCLKLATANERAVCWCLKDANVEFTRDDPCEASTSAFRSVGSLHAFALTLTAERRVRPKTLLEKACLLQLINPRYKSSDGEIKKPIKKKANSTIIK